MSQSEWLPEANYLNWKSAFKKFADIVVDQNGVTCIINQKVPMTLFNLVVETELKNNNFEDTINWVVNLYKESKIEFEWAITPFVSPQNWEEILQKYNFVELSKSPHMAVMNSELDLTHLENELDNFELDIRKVTKDTLDEYFIPFIQGFEFSGNDVLINGFKSVLPNFIDSISNDSESGLYTGYVNGKPVATSLGYISNDVMGIYNIATIPEYRRKGIGRMMTLDLMLRGVNEGVKASILQSSQMGKGVYEKLGFKVQFLQKNYILKK